MPPISPADAATIFRDAVAALSERLAGDYGELVPDASMERTGALLAKLEQGGSGSAGRGIRLADDHVATLDAWIRLADNAVLKGRPQGEEKCENCRYYLEPTAEISYCWHPKLRILVGDDWWCQWWEKEPDAT